jgi:subtilisin family serine protease
MTSEETNRIVSEDYADLLIETTGGTPLSEEFPGATIQPINNLLSVVHIPVSQITENTIKELGYGAFPSILGPVSKEALESSGINRIRNIPSFDLRGQGVLIGIIDSGIDYTNPIFRHADGTTRITALWDQTIVSSNPPGGLFYGTEYTSNQINLALQSDNPYAIVPSKDEYGHGTMLAGIAGGNEVPESDFYGVAPESDFVVVKLKQAKKYLKDFFLIPENAVGYQENDVSFALNYLLNVFLREKKPMVICIAVDTNQSSHDGRGTLSSYVSDIASTEGIAIITAVGNEGLGKRHFSDIPDKVNGFSTVELNVGENEQGFSMELWGHNPSILSVDILSPSGEYISRIASGVDDNFEITFVFEVTVIHLDFQMIESQSGDQLILFRFDKPAPGIWKINVYERGDIRQGFDIWLPMKGFISDSTFFIRPDPYTTVLTVATSLVPIAVTAYDQTNDNLYLDASRGYTRIGVVKPDIAAPGVNITGPTLDQGFADFTGTSAAAAHTTGVAVLLLEWGFVKGNLSGMSTIEMKKLMIRGARRSVDVIYPNRDWGFGILDLYNIFDSLRTGLTV